MHSYTNLNKKPVTTRKQTQLISQPRSYAHAKTNPTEKKRKETKNEKTTDNNKNAAVWAQTQRKTKKKKS